MTGEIISERRPRSNRNGERDHPGFAGDCMTTQTWPRLCPTDTHALFVAESHSFPRRLPGLLALELISNPDHS
jgi:hypothetical protein